MKKRQKAAVRILSTMAFIVLAVCARSTAIGQSTEQDFPTPVTTSEISGTIQPREIGDSRLTNYFYTFNGGVGDVFMNVVTARFNGTIDLFVNDGLRSLTKIVVYADAGERETGRVIYLRRPERLLLRVQGRPPGDEPAEFRIKFAGSFIAAAETAGEQPDLPTVRAENDSGVRVNSVGTIIEVIPKPTPAPVAAADKEEAIEKRADPAAAVEELPAPVTEPEKKLEVVVTDNVRAETKEPEPSKTTAPPRRSTRRTRSEPPAVKEEKAERREEPAADPLAGVRLVILFKDGGRIERSLPDVLRFTVDRGVLTVISKDGSIGRYQMINVSKVTIE